jgi:hypothetical protein
MLFSATFRQNAMGLHCELQIRRRVYALDYPRAYAFLGYLQVGEWRRLVRLASCLSFPFLLSDELNITPSAREFKSRAAKAIWDFEGVQHVLVKLGGFLHGLVGIYASSRHIPGVRFAGIPHPGLIGTAPSPEFLATWNRRETGLIAQFGTESAPPVAYAPQHKGAYVGQDIDDKIREKIYQEGARTIPGREHGGNCDVRFLQLLVKARDQLRLV